MCPYFATLEKSKLMRESVGAMWCYQSDIKKHDIQQNPKKRQSGNRRQLARFWSIF